MDFQFNSDNNIEGTSDMADRVEARIRERLARFDSRLTRIAVHVRDIDGATDGPDGVEASIEARPAGGQPIAVSDRADVPETAVNRALKKLVARLDSEFGKMDRVRR
ncbi:HPF/RaiA family ribosome-associated protein [Parasphingorhabdus sp.]|uniref:HPF/RaiA family ribosome-associated protein n=1 Tax=Parasphingorhabdus sp. TaxID=2709688 RepID=UPI0035943EBF